MKKNKNSKKWFNLFLVIVLLLILGGTGYMIYDSTREPSFNGGGTGGGGGGGTTNSSPSTPGDNNSSSPIVEDTNYYIYINEERGTKLEVNSDAVLEDNQVAEYVISLELSKGYEVAFGDSSETLNVYVENTESNDPYVADVDGTHTFHLKTWQDGKLSVFVEEPGVEDLVGKVESEFLKIRNMATKTDTEGNQVISFNYVVLPEEANDKTVSIDLSWTDSAVTDDISEYLSYTHTQESYYVEVTLLQRTNNQGKLTLTSNANSSATATVYIDYEQEFLGWNLSGDVVLQQTFELSGSETLNDVEDFKELMMTYSKGFSGTVAVYDKEISNVQLSLNSVAVVLQNPTVAPFLSENSDFNAAYETARENNTSTINFVNALGSYIETLSDEEKSTLRGSETATITAKYTVTFDFYGKSYEYTLAYVDTVATSAFADSTYVNVGSIETEGNIIFKLIEESSTVRITIDGEQGSPSFLTSVYIKIGTPPTSQEDYDYACKDGYWYVCDKDNNEYYDGIIVDIQPVVYIWTYVFDDFAGYKINGGSLINVGVKYDNATEVKLNDGDTITLVSTPLD